MAKRLLWIAIVFSLGRTSQAGEPGKGARFEVPGHGWLQMLVPEGWTSEVRQPPGGLPPTIVLRSGAGDDEQKLLVTALWSKSGAADFNTPESLRQLVQATGERALATAVETEITLMELQGGSGLGYWYSVTDRAPKPGEYEYATQGALAVGELQLSFTALTHQPAPEGAQAALEILASAQQMQEIEAGPAPARSRASSRHELQITGRDWVLALDLPGFEVEKRDDMAGRGGLLVAGHKQEHVVVTAVLWLEPGLDSSANCREIYQHPFGSMATYDNFTQTERGRMALRSWTAVMGLNGARQHHVEAFLAHDGACAALHISKEGYRFSDQTLFNAIVDSFEVRGL